MPNSEREGMAAIVHGIIIAGPVFSSSTSLSKFAVAERALVDLQNPQSEKHVERICTCRSDMHVDNLAEADATLSNIDDEREISALLSRMESETPMETE